MPPAQLGQQVQDDREEAVVGQQGCAVTALVVTEPLDHREQDADSGVLLLVAVDAPQHLFGPLHRRPRCGAGANHGHARARHGGALASWLGGEPPGPPGSAMTNSSLVVAGDWVTVGLG